MSAPREGSIIGTSWAATKAEIRVLADPDELSRAAANEFSSLARQAVATKGRFTVALAGGSTPRSAYAVLADENKRASPLPWQGIHVFFGDERHVPPDHAESNYGMVQDALLRHVLIPAGNVHRIHGELDATAAADQYEAELRRHFQLQRGQLPSFDLVMLGMGDDGHTASLFPATSALVEASRLVTANWVEQLRQYRITLTFPVLNNACEIMFLVAGNAKARVIDDLFKGDARSSRYPVHKVKPAHGRVLWLLDRAAAQAPEPPE
jgi:6-phosphogluconolactonase